MLQGESTGVALIQLCAEQLRQEHVAAEDEQDGETEQPEPTDGLE